MSTAIVPVDTSSALTVTSYLEAAREWLATAVEKSGPEVIARAKAEIATAAEATKQLNLSQEIQLDAQEMVRRAEYALGKSIRKGQAEGAVARRGQGGASAPGSKGDRSDKGISLPTHFASPGELSGQAGRGDGIYGLSDGVDREDFDEAIDAAKSEGNLSRSNIVRKIKGSASPIRKSRAQKAELLGEMAAQGYSSRQMCEALGFSRDDSVRELAREFGIEITADKQIGRTRRIDSTQVVENTATALEGLVMGVELINYQDVDPAVASQWADSLSDSMRALNRFVRKIKEKTQ